MPGEGDAIAQFVQNNMRIPRRGEVGWTGDEISNLEELGCVHRFHIKSNDTIKLYCPLLIAAHAAVHCCLQVRDEW